MRDGKWYHYPMLCCGSQKSRWALHPPCYPSEGFDHLDRFPRRFAYIIMAEPKGTIILFVSKVAPKFGRVRRTEIGIQPLPAHRVASGQHMRFTITISIRRPLEKVKVMLMIGQTICKQ